MKNLILTLSVILVTITGYAQNMSNQQIDKLLKANEKVEVIKSQMGFWVIKFYGKELNIITDESHNRMRIISPITEEKNVKAKQYKEIL